jgi:hypothetical protein
MGPGSFDAETIVSLRLMAGKGRRTVMGCAIEIDVQRKHLNR